MDDHNIMWFHSFIISVIKGILYLIVVKSINSSSFDDSKDKKPSVWMNEIQGCTIWSTNRLLRVFSLKAVYSLCFSVFYCLYLRRLFSQVTLWDTSMQESLAKGIFIF